MTLRRDWSDARRKVDDEGRCRLCSATGVRLEAAHILGRRYDRPRVEGSTAKTLYVRPASIVPLCGSTPEREGCHSRYDSGDVSILAVLTRAEQLQAVEDAGGIELARRRIDAPDYRGPIELARRESE
jgi:hypothetical protein